VAGERRPSILHRGMASRRIQLSGFPSHGAPTPADGVTGPDVRYEGGAVGIEGGVRRMNANAPLS
jgi:hypothetical protein